MAIQQASTIGQFVSFCQSEHNQLASSQQNESQSRGRPKVSSLLEILDGMEDLGASSSNLQDQVTIYQTVSNFPLLNYVNEPMSHFVCSNVKSAIAHLSDRIHAECDIPSNLYEAYQKSHCYNSVVISDEKPNLSEEIQYCTVTPNDGDGLVMNIDMHSDNPLENAVFTRLNGIDAPELYTVQFIKTDDLQHVFRKRVGHLSLCAIHLFLHIFNESNGTELCEEIPRDGYDEPIDLYDRPLKEFWFKFPAPPSPPARNYITSLENMVSSKPELRKRLMSPFRISTATVTEPFLLSLNALLVVTGFCHVFPKYCQDKLLLGLQGLAKEHKIGPLWCGATRNYTFGCETENIEDLILKDFTASNLANECNPEPMPLLPWHERRLKKSLTSRTTTRVQAKENITLAAVQKEPQIGMYIDITRYVPFQF